MSDAQPPFAGDDVIIAHGRAGLSLTITFTDAAGADRNVASDALYFEIDGVLRVALGAGAQDNQRVLTLTRAQVQAVGLDARKKFVVINETGGAHVCEWSGVFRVVGFLTQPS